MGERVIIEREFKREMRQKETIKTKEKNVFFFTSDGDGEETRKTKLSLPTSTVCAILHFLART